MPSRFTFLRARGALPQLALRLSFAMVLAVLLGADVQSRPQTPITPLQENFDGMAFDTAAPKTGVLMPNNQRAWIAQGRVRASFRLSTGLRMPAEDRSFPIPGSTHPDKMVALELDPLNSKLWTLTEHGLHVQSIGAPGGGTPGNPTQPVSLDLAAYITPPAGHGWNGTTDQDIMEDLKLSPRGDNFAFVLTHHRILVFRYESSQIVFKGSADELFNQGPDGYLNPPEAGSPPVADLEIYKFLRLRVIEDTSYCGGPRLMGFVMAEMAGYPPDVVPSRPAPNCIVACWLDQNSYQSPTFYDRGLTPACGGPPAPLAGAVVLYNAIPPPGTATLSDVGDLRVFCLDAFVDTADDDTIMGESRRKLAIGHGPAGQIRLADASRCFETREIEWDDDIHDIDPTPPDLDPADNKLAVQSILVDTYVPRRIYAMNPAGFWMLDWMPGAAGDVRNNVANEPNKKGVERDMVEVRWPSMLAPYTVWTATTSTVDHVCKVFEVSAQPPELMHQFYNMSSADGGVAIEGAGNLNVYLPTFGGVVRYHWNGSKFEAAPTGYKPAEDPLNSGQVDISEPIDVAALPPLLTTTPNRLLTASTRGDFMEFKVDSNTKDPLAPRRFKPNPLNSVLASWGYIWQYNGGLSTTTDLMYGNDVHFLDLVTSQWVLIDLPRIRWSGSTYSCSTTDACAEYGLLGYVWNSTQDNWEHRCTGVSPPILYLPDDESALSSTITVTKDKHWAIVATNIGIATYDISDLDDLVSPSITFGSNLCVGNNQNCNDNRRARALVHVRSTQPTAYSRVFAWINVGAVGEIRSYSFDEQTGTLTEITGTGLPVTTLPGFTGNLPTAQRARMYELNPASSTGVADVFFCSQTYFVQMRWDPATDPDRLTYKAHWPTPQESGLQDCLQYSMPQIDPVNKVNLVVKNNEGFGIIVPVP